VLRRQPVERGGPVGVGEDPRHPGVGPGRGERDQAGGEAGLGPGERGQREQPEDSIGPLRRHEVPRREQRPDRVPEPPGRHAQQRGGRLEEFPLGEERVPVVPGRAQGVEDPRLEARGRVGGDADRPRDRVRRLEADPPDLAGEAVGLLADHAAAVVPEALVEPHRERGGDAVALQGGHHRANMALLLPRRRDARGADLPDPLHLGEALRAGIDDVERPLAECVDDPSRHHRPDPLDQAAPQVAAHPLRRRGEARAVVEHLELPAVPGVDPPPALRDDRLARGQVGEGADDGDQAVGGLGGARPVPRALRGAPRDGVAVLGVLVRQPLDHPAQLLARRRLLGPATGCGVGHGDAPPLAPMIPPRLQPDPVPPGPGRERAPEHGHPARRAGPRGEAAARDRDTPTPRPRR